MHGLSGTVSICGFLWGRWELSVKQPCKSALSVGDGVHGHGGWWGKKELIGQFSTEGPWQIYPDGVGSVGVSDSVQRLSKLRTRLCNEAAMNQAALPPRAETGCPQQSQFKWALPSYDKKGISISSHTCMMAIELYFIPLLWYLCDLDAVQSSARAQRRLNSTLLWLSTVLHFLFDFLIYL